MATISPSEHRPSLLSRTFTAAEQMQMRQDDFAAGRNVSGILISVVGAAMLSGLLIVAWIALFAR